MFISDKFIFDGVHSDEMGVSLITLDSNMFNVYGFDFNEDISADKIGKDMSHFTVTDGEISEIELNIALVDNKNNPMIWDDDSIMEVTDWLITDKFVEFISEDNYDLIYYLKTKKITKNFTHDKKGYLQVALQPFSNSAYTKYEKKYTPKDNGEIVLENISNLKSMYSPIIEIKNLEDSLNIITIQNENQDGEPFVIDGLDNDEIVTIDSLMGTVFNDFKENKIMNCNRRWIRLKRGKNKIFITGNVEVTFKCQFPVRL